MRMLGASKANYDHTLICERNPRHWLVFDMTSLSDVVADYTDRKTKR